MSPLPLGEVAARAAGEGLLRVFGKVKWFALIRFALSRTLPRGTSPRERGDWILTHEANKTKVHVGQAMSAAEWLDRDGMTHAPCSGRHSLPYEFGLVKYSILVFSE